MSVAVGALMLIASLALLHYAGHVKLWDVTTRLPVILTVLSVAALVLALAGILVDSWLPPLLATCVAFYLLGQFFPDDLHLFFGDITYSVFKVGFWVGTAATVVMSVGGLLAMFELVRERAFFGPTAAGATAAARVGGTVPAASAAPPAPSAAAAPPANPASAATAAPAAGPASTPATVSSATPASNPPRALPPAGWYADPSGQARERYWSGTEWTDQVRS